MFPWFGTLKAADDEMSLMAKASYEVFRESKLQVFYEVSKTYYELYLIKHEIEISEKSLDILKTIERLALARFKGGSVAASGGSGINTTIPSAGNNSSGAVSSAGMNNMGKSATSGTSQPAPAMASGQMSSGYSGSGLTDLYRIQIEIGEAENNIASLQNRMKTLTVTFNNRINRSSLAYISLPDTMVIETLPLTLEAIHDTIRTNNPMIMMYGYEKQSIEARKRMVTRMGYPMIGAGVNYSLVNQNSMSSSSMNGKDMIMPMLKVTLPVYRKKYRSVQAETGFLENASGYGRDAAINTLETEYYTTQQEYQDAVRRFALNTNQFRLSDRSLSIMLKSYGAATTDLTSILQTRQQCLDYEIKTIEAVTDINISIARFRQLMATENSF